MGYPARKLDHNYTYNDYKSWNEDERWELICGEAWNMSPAPSRKHQWILMELARQVSNFLNGKPCQVYPAPFDVFFPDEIGQTEDGISTIVQPDISVVCDLTKLTKKGCLGAPDLVVEILSPYTSKRDLNEKFHLYEESGVLEYWIVDPGSDFIQVFSLGDNSCFGRGKIFVSEGVMQSTVLKGFSLDISELFRKWGAVE